MKKSIEDQISIPNKNIIKEKEKNINKKRIEDKISVREILRNQLKILDKIAEKAKKKILKKMDSNEKNLLNQIKNTPPTAHDRAK